LTPVHTRQGPPLGFEGADSNADGGRPSPNSSIEPPALAAPIAAAAAATTATADWLVSDEPASAIQSEAVDATTAAATSTEDWLVSDELASAVQSEAADVTAAAATVVDANTGSMQHRANRVSDESKGDFWLSALGKGFGIGGGVEEKGKGAAFARSPPLAAAAAAAVVAAAVGTALMTRAAAARRGGRAERLPLIPTTTHENVV